MARQKLTATNAFFPEKTRGLQVRMKEPLRAAIKAEARKNKRSQNAEIVHRLEAFDRQDMLAEVLNLGRRALLQQIEMAGRLGDIEAALTADKLEALK